MTNEEEEAIQTKSIERIAEELGVNFYDLHPLIMAREEAVRADERSRLGNKYRDWKLDPEGTPEELVTVTIPWQALKSNSKGE